VIRDVAAWRRFEDDEARARPLDIARNRRVFEAMWRRVAAQGTQAVDREAPVPAWKLRFAAALNVRGAPRADR
jgi:hypothetical protein